MNLFGKKSQKSSPPPPTAVTGGVSGAGDATQAAIAKNRDSCDTISKREDHLQRMVEKEVKNAKAYSAAKKQREAIMCIKRKKLYEKQLEQLSNTKFTLENQRMALESVNANKEAITAQQVGNAAMQSAMRQLGGLERVEEIIDEVEEGLQDAQDLGDVLGRSVSMPGVDADDDELAAELEGLMEDELAGNLSAFDLGTDAAEMPSAPVSFPSAGTAEVKGMSEEEKELAELEASMAM